jgi:hypothetical protein
MKMIEVNQVIVLELSAMQQIPDQSGIGRNGYTNCIFNRPHRGQRMGVRSDAT